MDKNPNTPSSDAKAMAPYFAKVDTILGGTDAMRAAAEYLPKFPDETDKGYETRRKSAKFTNIFRDIVENLAQRPFQKEVELSDKGATPELKSFCEDVDGRGSHINSFAGQVFFAGIASSIDWILVDYTKDAPANASRAAEKAIGARPYWLRIPASSMLAVYSDIINGKEEFTHVRFLEPETTRDGWDEDTAERVRVLTRDALEGGGYAPARFEVWEKKKQTAKGEEWELIEEGPISIGVIPLVPFITGRRKGMSWQFDPPMRDAADLQIEHYQQESALKHIKNLTAFPMLAGNGVTPQMGADNKPVRVPVGPHAVLYAPPTQEGARGAWEFIEPSAESLRFLADDIQNTARELRELGRQPLTAQSGNLTVVTTAVAAEKGNAAIQAWALNLKDALENALVFTAMWLKSAAQPEVIVFTDFSLGYGDDDSFAHVLAMGTGDAPVISRDAMIHEAKRRDILDADYDADADALKILGNEE